MAELKAGGIALVYGLKKYSKFNGRCVRLVEKVSPGEIYKSPIDNKMWQHHPNASSWICVGDVTNTLGEYGWGVFAPQNLLPIDGEDFSEELRWVKEISNA